MALVGWVDPEVVAERWLDAPDGEELSELLQIAWEVCSAYAPAIIETPPPARYAKAQLLQAQHLYARSKSGNGDSIGPDGFTVSTYSLVLEARSLLRPPSRRGGIF